MLYLVLQPQKVFACNFIQLILGYYKYILEIKIRRSKSPFFALDMYMVECIYTHRTKIHSFLGEHYKECLNLAVWKMNF